MPLTPSPTTQPLRVLGIDPGLADVGYGVIDWGGEGCGSQLVDYGVIRTPVASDLAARLDCIYQRLSALIEQFQPNVVAIEQLYFAKNIKTAMVVAHGRAACILATARRGVSLTEYTPLQIKQALTGHGRASKHQVQMMVRAVLGLKEIPRPDHAADALAAALCHVQTIPMREKLNGARLKAGLLAQVASEEDPRKVLLAQSRFRRSRGQNR